MDRRGLFAATAIGAAFLAQKAATASPAIVYGPAMKGFKSALSFADIDPTGVTDSTAGFNAAFTSFGGPGAIYVPAGTYLVTGPINIGPGQHLICAGSNAVTFNVGHATNDIFTFVTGGTGYDSSVMTRFKIKAIVTRTGGRFIYSNVSRSIFVSEFVLEGAYIGIEAKGILFNARDGQIQNTVATTGVGILVSGGNDHKFDNILMNTTGTQPLAGVQITSAGGCWFSRLDLIQCGDGVLLNPGTGQSVRFMNFTDVDCDTCSGYGWHLEASGTGELKSIALTTCWGATSTLDGFLIKNAYDIHFSNVRAVNNTQAGIRLAGTTNAVTIVGGQVGANSPLTSTYPGIHIESTVTDVTVAGVRVGGKLVTDDTQLYGILFDAGCDYITVAGCDLKTAHTAISGTIGLNSRIVGCPGLPYDQFGNSIRVGQDTLASAATVAINSAAGQARDVIVQTAGLSRWGYGSDSGAESGANAGTGWRLRAYDDSGNFLFDPITVVRSTGVVTLGQGASVANGLTVSSGGAAVNGASASDNAITVGSNALAAGPTVKLNAAAGNSRTYSTFTAGVLRWDHGAGSGAESGANAGSDWRLRAYSDAGAVLFDPISVVRSTGMVNLNTGLQVTGNVGFYGTAAIAQQTGVAVDVTAIHTALVNLGLITS